MVGVKGNVEFVTVSSDTTSVTLDLTTEEAWPNWEIREFPIITTHASNSCSDELLGNQYVLLSLVYII